MIGSIAGAGLLAGGVFFFLWHRKNKDGNLDDSHDDEFTLSGPEKFSSDYQINSHPFNHNSNNPSNGSAALGAMGVAMAPSGGARRTPSSNHNSNNSNNHINHHNQNSSDFNHSYSSHLNNDEPFSNFDHNDDFNFNRPEELGRRRLSDGSLPDMIARNPGSLKVVN